MIKLKGKICDIELKIYKDAINKYELQIGSHEYNRTSLFFNSLDDLVEFRGNLDHIVEFMKKRES